MGTEVRGPLRVLILEDNSADAELMARELIRAGFAPQSSRVQTREDFLARLDADLELILADYSLPGFDAAAALELLRERGADIPFIVVTGSVSEEAAVACMRAGAADYLLKDRLARLGPAVGRALEQRRLRAQKRGAEEALRESEEKYRLLMTHAGIGISSWSPEGRLLLLNDAGAAYLRGTPETLVGTARIRNLRHAAVVEDPASGLPVPPAAPRATSTRTASSFPRAGNGSCPPTRGSSVPAAR